MKQRSKQLRRSIRRYILIILHNVINDYPYVRLSGSISALCIREYTSPICILCIWGTRFTAKKGKAAEHTATMGVFNHVYDMLKNRLPKYEVYEAEK